METLTCRICLDECERKELIAPCSCKGTQRWVHRACLDQWRATREDRAFSKCTECMFEYHLVSRNADSADARRKRMVRYSFLVARDFALAFALTQSAVLFFSFIGYGADSGSQTLLKAFHAETHARLFYYFFGLVLFLATVGLLFMVGALGTVTGGCDCCRDCHPFGCYYAPDCCMVCPQCGECGALTTAECSAECGPAALVVLGLLAIVGVFASFFAGVAYVGRVTARHLHVLQKQGLAADFIVKDLCTDSDAAAAAGEDDSGGLVGSLDDLEDGRGGLSIGGSGIEMSSVIVSPLQQYFPVSSDSRHGGVAGDGFEGDMDMERDLGASAAGASGGAREQSLVSHNDQVMLRSMGLL